MYTIWNNLKGNPDDESEFLDQRTGRYRRLHHKEYLLTYYSKAEYPWNVFAIEEKPRENRPPIKVIEMVYFQDGNSPCFKTLPEAKAWIKSVNGKHIKHYNTSH